jgi:lipopolysaccharide export system protein LptA
MFRSAALAAAAALALLGASPSPSAAPVVPSGTGTTTINGYRVETTTTDWNANTGEFTMPNEVRVTRQGSDARGDRAHGNSKAGIFVLQGSVVLHDTGEAAEGRQVGPEYAGPATLTCDTLTIDSKGKNYDAQGNVHFVQGSRNGVAHHATLNDLTHQLHLDGDVLLVDGQTTFRAEVVDYNLLTKDVRSSGAPIVIREPIHSAGPTPSPSPRPSPTRRPP